MVSKMAVVDDLAKNKPPWKYIIMQITKDGR